MLSLCIILFLQIVCSYEVMKYSNGEHSADIFALSKNTTLVNDKKCDESKTQLIEGTPETDSLVSSLSLNSSLRVKTKIGSNLENFKPSPQLETYYEYNKFPVEPALPEAKIFGNLHQDTFSSWNKKSVIPQWLNKPNVSSFSSKNLKDYKSREENHKFSVNSWGDKTTTEQPWVSRIKFPPPSYISTNERPYKFVINNDKLPNYHSINFPVTTPESFSFNKPVETSNKNTKPSEGFWEKLMSYGINKNRPQSVQKTYFDYNLLENFPHDMPHKEHEHGIYYAENPWRKIIKLLSAVIPIGLLISALTPTVITVTPVNDTQSRYRAEDAGHQEITSRLASSLHNLDKLGDNSCENKVLCELLVSASILKNSDEHIENLLKTFSEHGDVQNKKDLIKIFEAVKNEDCDLILCVNIK